MTDQTHLCVRQPLEKLEQETKSSNKERNKEMKAILCVNYDDEQNRTGEKGLMTAENCFFYLIQSEPKQSLIS